MSTPARKPISLPKRIGWAACLYIVRVLLKVFVFARRIKPPSSSQRPTYTKYYHVRPNLVNHVWIPDSYKSGSSPLLPLLIDIHGGGFCFGHPAIDDPDNAILCQKHGICVVSINYRKAPGSPFPIPVEDAAALIEAVLDDQELPVDKTKIAVAGYSAGGNLSFTAPQINGLHKRIKGVVAIYPATDLSRMLKTRIESATPPVGRKDILISMVPAFNWAYIPKNQDLQDPLLSPIFAPREVLPQKLYIIGCENDLLCAEARDMAVKLAELDVGEVASMKQELGNRRIGWQSNSVTWEELTGLEHGFNQRYSYETNNKRRELWKKRTEEMHAGIAEWLFKEVYND